MPEKYLTDDLWLAVAPVIPGKEGDPGCHGRNNRQFLEAVFWVVRSKAPWRNLPPEYGKWYTTYTRYRRWEKKGVWPKVLAALHARDHDCAYFYVPSKGVCWTPPAARPTQTRTTCSAA